jgi:hypothetical protein
MSFLVTLQAEALKAREHTSRRRYLEALWESHDWLEREIIREERRYSDGQLDRILER